MSVIFGGDWGAPVCAGATVVPAPLGDACGYCEEPIRDGDQGVLQVFVRTDGADRRPIHKECMLRQVLGGYGHHMDHAYWCGQMHDPDGGLSRRESSLRVWELTEIDLW